ncbi:MAG: magnesium transporter [Bdellovibrionaceae bacterium]|nr:magnesium transporter [Pseudobdellovibrionaceae bacterium]
MQNSTINKLLDKAQKVSLKSLRHISNIDLAEFLSETNPKSSTKLFKILLDYKIAVSVLSEMKTNKLKQFLNSLSKKTLIKLFSEGPMDDLIYLIELTKQPKDILKALPAPQQILLKKFMAYPKDSAGRIMQDDYFSIPYDSYVEESIEKLREYSREKFVHYIYAINSDQILQGVLSIRELAISQPQTQIKEIINSNVITASPLQSESDVAQLVSRHNFIAVPIIDNSGKMLGLITVDDVLDIIEESATAQIYAMAGLTEDDRVYTTSAKAIKNRLPWLGLNLIFAVLASSIIALFEQTMSRLIILATLKNIVAGIGGNTAIQTLTVTTRGLDTGDFRFTSFRKALTKESLSGLTTGFLLGLGASIITYFWKGSLLVSFVIFLAMLFNSILAVWLGFLIPILMRKLKKDPAVSSGVFVTVITDIFGFFIFLSLASLGLKIFGESL